MDLKKAQLSDDAALYNHGPEKSDKEKWAEMDKKQKWEFFKAYYLWKTIFAIAMVGILIYLGYTMFGPKPTRILNIASNGFLYVPYSEITEGFMESQGLNPDEYELNVDPTYNLNSDSTSMQRFNVYCYTGDLDIIISSTEAFERYAAQGYYKPLENVLTAEQLEWFKERGLLYESCIKETNDDGIVIKEYENHYYGICLDNTTLFDDYVEYVDHVYIGIITKTTNLQYAIDYIQYIYDNYGK